MWATLDYGWLKEVYYIIQILNCVCNKLFSEYRHVQRNKIMLSINIFYSGKPNYYGQYRYSYNFKCKYFFICKEMIFYLLDCFIWYLIFVCRNTKNLWFFMKNIFFPSIFVRLLNLTSANKFIKWFLNSSLQVFIILNSWNVFHCFSHCFYVVFKVNFEISCVILWKFNILP